MPCAKTHHHHQRFWSLHPPHPTVTATRAVGEAIPSLWPRVVATGGDWSIRVPHRGPLMGPRPVCREVSLVSLCVCVNESEWKVVQRKNSYCYFFFFSEYPMLLKVLLINIWLDLVASSKHVAQNTSSRLMWGAALTSVRLLGLCSG